MRCGRCRAVAVSSSRRVVIGQYTTSMCIQCHTGHTPSRPHPRASSSVVVVLASTAIDDDATRRKVFVPSNSSRARAPIDVGMRAETSDRLNDESIDDDAVARAMRRFVRETCARTAESEVRDPATGMNIFESALEGFRRSCARALDVGVDEMTRVLREAGTKWEGKAREDEGKARETTRALTRARREIERLNEKLGREMIRRGADEEREGEGVELARRETTLYREACRKYRKRAEHYEALYRKMGGKDVEGTTTTTRVGRGGRRGRDERREGTSGGRRALDGVDGDARRGGDDWRFLETTTRTSVEGGRNSRDARARAMLGRNVRRPRDDGSMSRRGMGLDASSDARTRETKASSTRMSCGGRRKRDGTTTTTVVVAMMRARDGRPRRATASVRTRVRISPPPRTRRRDDARRGAALDRIFLDSKNAPASSPSRENGDNKVRKNKCLSDNAPRSPNAVFDDAGNARRRATKYRDVVRKKSERELLDAYVCPDCQTFYDAMMPGKDRSTIKCTHAPPRENVIANSRHRGSGRRNRRRRGFGISPLRPKSERGWDSRGFETNDG